MRPKLTSDPQQKGASIALSGREQWTIANILRVNHAGEHGAIRIYRAQIWVSRWRAPDVVPLLEHMLSHEIDHGRMFRAAMIERGSTPCYALWFWGLGGTALGFTTALLGRAGTWTCTAAIESAVHRHMDDQLLYLAARDRSLHDLIQSIQVEELSHYDTAKQHLTDLNLLQRALNGVVSFATDALIWLSTYGASSRMARNLKLARTVAA